LIFGQDIKHLKRADEIIALDVSHHVMGVSLKIKTYFDDLAAVDIIEVYENRILVDFELIVPSKGLKRDECSLSHFIVRKDCVDIYSFVEIEHIESVGNEDDVLGKYLFLLVCG
jgi:hypothetical protein